jgi:FkbM family methyltransferase
MTKFSIDQIVAELPIRGVIHIGAYIGEEFGVYKNHGIKNVLLFEPQRQIYDILLQKIAPLVKDESITAFNTALGNFNGETEMFIASNPEDPLLRMPGTASSSILRPKKHLTEHTMVTFPIIEIVKMSRLDDIIIDHNIDMSKFNFINIDVQGYELEVFKGAIKTLAHIDYIVSEVNNDELYEKCTLIETLDMLLNTFGFVRENTDWVCKMWGNAFYRKVT